MDATGFINIHSVAKYQKTRTILRFTKEYAEKRSHLSQHAISYIQSKLRFTKDEAEVEKKRSHMARFCSKTP